MKNSRKIVIAMICICVICLIGLIISINKKQNEEFDVVLQDDLETIEDVCSYFKIEYISEDDIANFDFVKRVFLKFPYDTQTENGKTSKSYYDSALHALAKVYKYKDILVIDEEKSLQIQIESSEVTKTLEKYIINGDENYFQNLESKLNLANLTKIELKEINAKSSIIVDLIKNNWKADSVNFGTKDSTLKDYEIYFDEGIQVRKIAGKVFNIVFTEKYTAEIIDGGSVNTDFETIKSKYGTPSFTEMDGILGYKTKDYYIFFGKGQVSIYRVDTYDTQEFAKLVTEFISSEDEKTFAKKLKELWPDYDYFSQNENTEQIELTYTLKGIKFNINMSREQGLTLYSNFNGQVTNKVSFEQILQNADNIPAYTYVKSKDLVYSYEVDRSYGIYNNDSALEQYIYAYGDSYNKQLDIYYDKSQSDFANPSNQFFCLKDGLLVRVFSRTNSYAPIEIPNVYCILWADNTHLLYSINKKGIYMYDAISRNTKTILEGNGAYKIKSYENGILKYDNENIEINVE